MSTKGNQRPTQEHKHANKSKPTISAVGQSADPKLAFNLGILQKRDPNAIKIIGQSAHVALYSFNSKSKAWERSEVEGSLFLLQRRVSMFYRIVIMNRLTPNDFQLDIAPDTQLQIVPPFIYVKRRNSAITGLWFYSEDEMKVIGDLIKQVVASLNPATKGNIKARSASNSTTNTVQAATSASSASVAKKIRPDTQSCSTISPGDPPLTASVAHLMHLARNDMIKGKGSVGESDDDEEEEEEILASNVEHVPLPATTTPLLAPNALLSPSPASSKPKPKAEVKSVSSSQTQYASEAHATASATPPIALLAPIMQEMERNDGLVGVGSLFSPNHVQSNSNVRKDVENEGEGEGVEHSVGLGVSVSYSELRSSIRRVVNSEQFLEQMVSLVWQDLNQAQAHAQGNQGKTGGVGGVRGRK